MNHTSRRLAVGGLALLAATSVLLPSGASADPTPKAVQVTAEGYWTAPATDALPPALTTGFPPGVVCLVAGLGGAERLCGPEVQQLKQALDLDSLPIPTTPDGDLPQPIQPNTLPVGQLGGQTRYAAGLQLQLPPVPLGHEVDRFDLVLHPHGISYAFESPAFRDLTVAALSQVSKQSPDPFRELLTRIAAGTTPVMREKITGIEACPATESWKASTSEDIDLVPEVDCILGSTAVYDAESDTYRLDLKFAAQAWYSGDLPNNGIILRPVGAENLAYGDPDLSTNWTVSFAGGEAGDTVLPQVVMATFATPADPPPFVPAPTAPPSQPLANPDPFVPLPTVSDTVFTPAPASSPTGPTTVRRLVPGQDAPVGGTVQLASTVGDLPVWTWPLLLAVLVAMLVYGNRVYEPALLAEARLESEGDGALSRLVARAATREDAP